MECWVATCYRSRGAGGVYCDQHEQPTAGPGKKRIGVVVLLEVEGTVRVAELAVRRGTTTIEAYLSLQELVLAGRARMVEPGVYEAVGRP